MASSTVDICIRAIFRSLKDILTELDASHDPDQSLLTDDFWSQHGGENDDL